MSAEHSDERTDAAFNPAMLENNAEVRAFWDSYYPRIRRAVALRLRHHGYLAIDESAVAHSAMNCFLMAAIEGRFPQLDDSDSLWKLLKTIAIRKANDHCKRSSAAKRGGQAYRITQVASYSDSSTTDPLDLAADSGADPTQDAEVNDLFNTLFDKIPDARDRDIVLLRLQGASLSDIAEGLKISTKTVQRILKRIEERWEKLFLEE